MTIEVGNPNDPYKDSGQYDYLDLTELHNGVNALEDGVLSVRHWTQGLTPDCGTAPANLGIAAAMVSELIKTAQALRAEIVRVEFEVPRKYPAP
jgi:hypothetical protein